jgi:hypothetical protein
MLQPWDSWQDSVQNSSSLSNLPMEGLLGSYSYVPNIVFRNSKKTFLRWLGK